MKKIINWLPDLTILLVVVFCVVVIFDDLGIGLSLLALCLPFFIFLFLSVNKLFKHFTGKEILKRRKLYKKILRISLPISIALIAGVANIESQVGGATFFLVLIPIFFFLVLVAWAILKLIFKFDLLKSLNVPAGLTIVLLLFSFWISGKMNIAFGAYQFPENKFRAEKIIACLKDYKKEMNGYPFSLDKLTPKYCSEIPKYFYGLSKNNFDYTFKGDEYYLSFSNHYGWDDTYYSSSSKWMGK